MVLERVPIFFLFKIWLIEKKVLPLHQISIEISKYY